MRTTLAIDDDVLAAAKALGKQRGCSLSEVISDLVRRALPPPNFKSTRNGFPLLLPKLVTLDVANALRDELP